MIKIPYEDEVLEEHTDIDLFCGSMSCPCHEDQESIQAVGEQVAEGLMTPGEADRYFRGKTI